MAIRRADSEMGCFGTAWSVSVVQGGAIDPTPILYLSIYLSIYLAVVNPGGYRLISRFLKVMERRC